MPPIVRHYLLVLAAAVTVLFTNLGGPRLWDRDEPRNAGCAQEMLQRGDWVVPVFNGELRTHKPVLLYWFMMTAYATLGVSEFAARFWSAALGLATVLMTYHMGRRLFSPAAGLWSALALAPALMFGVAGRAATPDSVLIFCSTLAIFAYVMFTFRDGQFVEDNFFPRAWWKAALIYGAMGLAILAKGPVGIVLPTAVIGMFLLIMRLPPRDAAAPVTWATRLVALVRPFEPRHFLKTCWIMRPLTAIGVALAVALPWYVWVDQRTAGAWTEGFFFDHNLGRATQAMEGHEGPIFFYIVALAVGFFPWSVFLAPMLVDTVGQARRRSPWNHSYLFAACWVGVYVGLFSLAETKLPSYITPCYPGMALLMGAFVSRLAAREISLSHRWLQLATGVAAVVGLVLLIGLPIAAAKFLPGEEWLAGIGLAPLVAGIAGWVYVSRGDYSRLVRGYAVGAVAFSTMLLALAAQRVDRQQQSDELLAAAYAASPAPQIGYMQALEPSWVVYGGVPLTSVTVPGDPEPLTAELAPVPGTYRWERRPKLLVDEFFAASPHRFLITTRSAWNEAAEIAPADVQVLAEVPYFLKKERLVLVGRRGNATHTAGRTLPPLLERHRR